VCGLSQVGRACLRIQLRPKGVDDLLSKESVPLREAQQLNELDGSQAGPALGRDLDPTDRYGEVAENSNFHAVGRVGPLVGRYVYHKGESLLRPAPGDN
jgi:hypothetical protein